MKLSKKLHSYRACAFAFLLALTTICLISSPSASSEYRAWWVSSWGSPGMMNQTDVNNLLGIAGNGSSLGHIRNANCNSVIVEVRRSADVCYPSGLNEPYFSGLSPSTFNALQAIINAAHDTTGGKKRIDVHAWIVVFRTGGNSVYNAHNDTPTGSLTNLDNYWPTRTDTGAEPSGYPFDPGHPMVEDYITKVCMDLANNFDIDGIHYDYVRFTASNQGYNPTSLARYNARYGLSGSPSSTDPQWEQWRRDQITNLVRRVYHKVQVVKPSIKMSGAFVCGHPEPPSATRNGFTGYTQAYNDYFQDWDSWVQEGIVDMAVPMTYFDRSGSHAGDWVGWLNFQKDRHGTRHMITGPGLYLNSLSNAILELQDTRTPSANNNHVHGFSGYEYQAPYSGGSWSGFSSTLKSQVTPTWDDIPAMPWKTAPTKGHLHGTVMNGSSWVDGASISVGFVGSTITDGTGFYGYVDVAPGVYSVTCNATEQGLGTQTKSVTVVAGEVSVVNFTWGTTTGMSGYVRTTGGTPVAGARIVGGNGAYVSTSGADGSYTLPGMAAGTFSFKCTKPNYTVHTKSATVTNGATASVDFTVNPLASTGTINGYVRNSSGVGVSGAGVATNTGGYSTTTAADGYFSMANVAIGTYNVTASKAGYASDTETGVVVSAGGTSTIYPVIDPNGIPDVIVDNVDAGWSITSGTWLTGTGTGMYGADYRFADTGSPNASCAWTPTIATAGNYDVYVWYRSGTNRANNAPFTINYMGGSATVYVDQTQNGGAWFKIGTALPFTTGTAGSVTLNDNAQASKVVMADAIRLVYTGPTLDTTPPTVPTGLAATATSTVQMQLSWNASTDASGVEGYHVYRNGALVRTVTSGTSCVDVGLTANTSYTYSVDAYDIHDNTSSQCTGVTRATLCVPISVTCDKPTSTWQTASNVFTFTNARGFGGTTTDHIRYVWDRVATHTWTDTETSWTSGTKACTASPGASNWYFHARAYNADNVPNGQVNLGPFFCDTTAPGAPVPSVAKYVPSTSQLSSAWTAVTDTESGIVEYQYAIGTTPGGTTVKSWTTAGMNTSATATGLSLALDQPYYFTVKAKNGAGTWGAAGNSTSSTPAQVCASIADARQLPNNRAVLLADRRVGYGGTDGAYIQDPNRIAALYLPTVTTLGTNNVVDIGGILGTSGLHRVLTNPDPQAAAGDALKPVAMRLSDLGGAQLNDWTPGFPGAVGVNNLGLLVKVFGTVTSSGGGYFTLTDGQRQVRVKSSVSPSGNVYVTGISSWTNYGGQDIPLIITRYPSDVHSAN